MAMESSVLPLPSELVIPPVAHLAYVGKIPMTLWGIVLAGTLGSWVGATVMYWAARLAGRPIVMRYGKYAFIPPQKVEGAERWAAHYGGMGIFISRLLPVVRHLIGIPAGIVRMNYWKFSAFTVAGAAFWCSVLCWLGVKMGQDEQLMKGEYHRVTLWLAGAMLVLGGLYYFFVHRHMAKKPEIHSTKSE
jgi:membrane protein DedA with SNARE-associated domain